MERTRRRWSFRRFFLSAAAVCAFAYLVATSFEVALVPTASMENTVLVGDHVLVAKLAYAPKLPVIGVQLPRWKRAHRGDLVSFRHPRTGLTYLKRVVAIGGDTVEIRDHKLIVNGTVLPEQYVSSSRLWRTMAPQQIKPDDLFVLGDNRDNSEDSRYWGTVPESAVVGEPAMVLWSFRAPTSEWLDGVGNVRAAAYLDVTTHFFSRTRWSRVARHL